MAAKRAERSNEAFPTGRGAGSGRAGRPLAGDAARPLPHDGSETDLLRGEVERLARELAAMREKVSELEAHAERDPLTDLLNRRAFARELDRAAAHVQRYGGRVVLVYLDLDGFKQINDQHGHAAGDAVLQAVARGLCAHVRTSDIVARLGGDEFAVLLWNLSDADAASKASALEEMIAATAVPWSGARLVVGASAGTASLDSGDPAAALAAADAAMYRRKRAPRP